MKDPKRAAPQAVLFAPVKAVRVVGEYTVELETQEPFASLRNNLAHPNAGIVSPTADRKLGAEFGRRPVSAGPYSLAEWVSGDRIVLKRFDKYVGPKPFYDTIVFRAVPEPQTRLAMVQRGEADVAIRMPASLGRRSSSAARASRSSASRARASSTCGSTSTRIPRTTSGCGRP